MRCRATEHCAKPAVDSPHEPRGRARPATIRPVTVRRTRSPPLRLLLGSGWPAKLPLGRCRRHPRFLSHVRPTPGSPRGQDAQGALRLRELDHHPPALDPSHQLPTHTRPRDAPRHPRALGRRSDDESEGIADGKPVLLGNARRPGRRGRGHQGERAEGRAPPPLRRTRKRASSSSILHSTRGPYPTPDAPETIAGRLDPRGRARAVRRGRCRAPEPFLSLRAGQPRVPVHEPRPGGASRLRRDRPRGRAAPHLSPARAPRAPGAAVAGAPLRRGGGQGRPPRPHPRRAGPGLGADAGVGGTLGRRDRSAPGGDLSLHAPARDGGRQRGPVCRRQRGPDLDGVAAAAGSAVLARGGGRRGPARLPAAPAHGGDRARGSARAVGGAPPGPEALARRQRGVGRCVPRLGVAVQRRGRAHLLRRDPEQARGRRCGRAGRHGRRAAALLPRPLLPGAPPRRVLRPAALRAVPPR